MQLAYVFWHQPAPGIDAAAYEERLRAFHGALGLAGSRTLRLDRAPWDGEDARWYEDWYPVEDWRELGTLNERAVSGARRDPHDAAATRAGTGAGGVYGLRAGSAEAAGEALWVAKPAGMAYDELFAALREAAPDATVWQRQMVLGPAPEFCVVGADELPWPARATGAAPI